MRALLLELWEKDLVDFVGVEHIIRAISHQILEIFKNLWQCAINEEVPELLGHHNLIFWLSVAIHMELIDILQAKAERRNLSEILLLSKGNSVDFHSPVERSNIQERFQIAVLLGLQSF